MKMMQRNNENKPELITNHRKGGSWVYRVSKWNLRVTVRQREQWITNNGCFHCDILTVTVRVCRQLAYRQWRRVRSVYYIAVYSKEYAGMIIAIVSREEWSYATSTYATCRNFYVCIHCWSQRRDSNKPPEMQSLPLGARWFFWCISGYELLPAYRLCKHIHVVVGHFFCRCCCRWLSGDGGRRVSQELVGHVLKSRWAEGLCMEILRIVCWAFRISYVPRFDPG